MEKKECKKTAISSQGNTSWWKKFSDASKPAFEELGNHTENSCSRLSSCKSQVLDYCKKLEDELNILPESSYFLFLLFCKLKKGNRYACQNQ